MYLHPHPFYVLIYTDQASESDYHTTHVVHFIMAFALPWFLFNFNLNFHSLSTAPHAFGAFYSFPDQEQ